MKRFILYISLALSLPQFGLAQTTEGSRLLNATELREKPWHYSLESALAANPLEVYKLSLSDQSLKTVPEEVFQFTNLQVLNLNSCKLKSIPDSIGVLTHLEMLSLYNNKLRTLPLTFRKLSQLEVLYIGSNKLTTIPIWIGGMGKLRMLDITRNPITPLELIQLKQLMPKLHVTY